MTAPGATIRQYNVQPDDTVKNGRLFIDMSSDKSGPGGPDGVRVDSKGNVWSSGSARHLDHVAAGEASGHDSRA